MPTRVAINGFGRIGRAVLRTAYEREADIEIVAVNDITDVPTLAHLLARDSVYGRFPAPVIARDGVIDVAGHEILALSGGDPAELPWADLGVDVVIEATGRFRTRADAQHHLDAGARKVSSRRPPRAASRP